MASELDITNGHAARMRYSRFKAQMEGKQPAPRKPRSSTPRNKKPKPQKPSKAEAKDEGPPPLKAETAQMDGIEPTVKREPVIKAEPGHEHMVPTPELRNSAYAGPSYQTFHGMQPSLTQNGMVHVTTSPDLYQQLRSSSYEGNMHPIPSEPHPPWTQEGMNAIRSTPTIKTEPVVKMEPSWEI